MQQLKKKKKKKNHINANDVNLHECIKGNANEWP